MTPAKEILIVDDEVGIRELLSEILQDEGYRVSPVSYTHLTLPTTILV